MGFFNKHTCHILMLILLLVVVYSLVTGSSLVEGHSKNKNDASKAISNWQKSNKKKIQTAINGISSSAKVPDVLTKLKNAFDLDQTATQALKLAGGGLFGSFESGNDDDDASGDDDDDDGSSSWL